jgi:hypothetical protein
MVDACEIFLESVNIGSYDIGDMNEITSLTTITKNSGCFAVFDFFEKDRDYACLTESILARSVDIGIAEHRGVKSILPIIEFEQELDSTL